jgi:radical SAM PhpK family P-methyltransferase
MVDCLIIGFNDSSFQGYVEMVHSMGDGAGAYKDLSLAFVRVDGRPLHALDVINHFRSRHLPQPVRRLHNADFLWPVVLVLGSYLTRHGFTFDYVNLFQQEKEKLRQKLSEGVRAVAITTTLYVSPHPIREIISFIRQHAPDVRIVIGGPFIAGQPKMLPRDELERLFKYLGGDIYVISNEGEATLANLLRALENGASLSAVGNLAYRSGDEYVITPLGAEYNALEENPVDYTLFPREEIGRFLSLRTAKSCPFSCAFCGFPERAGKYKYLDVQRVEEELDRIRDIGTVDTLTFLDDTFNVPQKRFKELLRMMIRNRYPFRWNSFYRSDHGDAETIDLMAQAGCEGVFLGVESGSNRMLKHMNKNATREAYLDAIPRLRAAGISTYASIIIGFPGETLDTCRETFEFIEEARPDFFRAQLWYCDPITPIWEKRAQYNLSGAAFRWSHATMDSEMACELIDRMFLGVQGSIWLPQFGFEQWSTFYLQRHGASMDAIKAYLRCFNAAIKERLLHEDREPLGGPLLAALERGALLGQGDPPDLAPVEALDGARYLAAERFFASELSGAPRGALSWLPSGAWTGSGELAVWAQPQEAAPLASLSARAEVSQPVAALAVFSALLSRLSGQEDGALLVAMEGAGGAVPLRVRTPWARSLAEHARGVRDAWSAAEPHRRFGLHLLHHPLRLRAAGCEPPRIDVAFAAGVPLAEALRDHPDVARSISLALEAIAAPAGTALRLLYRPDRLDTAAIARVSDLLGRMLAQAGEDASLSIGAVALEERRRAEPRQAAEDEADFNFS